MKLQVHIENYQILEAVDVEAEGITVISGKTSNGKSSLYRAIRSACFGRRGDDFIRTGADKCVVALNIDGETFAWAKDDTIDFYHGEKRFTKTGGQPPDEYLAALKIKELEFGKALTISPNFAGQFDSLFLVGLSPVDAASALSSLFSGEKFPQLLKQISKSVKDTKKEVTYAEGVIYQLEQTTNQLAAQRDAKKWLESWRYSPEQIKNMTVSHFQCSDRMARIRAANDEVILGKTKLDYAARHRDVLKSASADAAVAFDKVAGMVDSLCRADLAVIGMAESNKTVKAREEKLVGATQEVVDVHQQLVATIARVLSAIESVGKQASYLAIDKRKLDALQAVREDAVPQLEALQQAVLRHETIDQDAMRGTIKWEGQIKEQQRVDEQLAELQKQLTQCPSCDSELNDRTREVLLRNVV